MDPRKARLSFELCGGEETIQLKFDIIIPKYYRTLEEEYNNLIEVWAKFPGNLTVKIVPHQDHC